MDLQQLKTHHLWDCANVLRGSAVDRTDWKGYILPLLFFKRLCDVWGEETDEAVELYGDVDPVDFPEVHRFSIPEGCHWSDVRGTPANVGAALSHALREIERTNPDTLPHGHHRRTVSAEASEFIGEPKGRSGAP